MNKLVIGIIIVLFLSILPISQISWALSYDKIESDLISPNQTFQYTFTKTGTFQYHCQLHPWLRGIIEVDGSDPPINVIIKIPKGAVESASKVSFEPNYVVIPSGSTVIWNNTDAFSHTVANIDLFPETFYDDLKIFFPIAPLKQIKSGISIDKIECRDYLTLVTKHDGSPACVRLESVINLIERGWAYHISGTSKSTENSTEKIWVGINPIQCLGNPWERDWLKSHNNTDTSYPRFSQIEGLDDREYIIITDYYKKIGITIFDARLATWGAETLVCAGCNCSNGHVLYLLVVKSDINKMLNLDYNISREEALKHVGEKLNWTFKPYNYKVSESINQGNNCVGMDCNNIYSDLKCGVDVNGFGRYGFLIKDNGSVVNSKERGILYHNAIIDYSLCK